MKSICAIGCLLLLFALAFAPLSAQSFLPMDWQQGVYFNGNSFNSPPPGNASVRHVSDTTKCGYTYAKICRWGTWSTSGSCTFVDFLRQTGTRIYIGGDCNWPDDLLFDFGLVVGDTISIRQSYCHSGLYEVDSVYTVTLLDGSQRPKFVLHGRNNWNLTDTLRWIQDIGDISFGMVPNCDFEGGHGNLICHKENGIKRFVNNTNLVLADCDSLTPVGITPSALSADLAVVAPNPCSQHLRIAAYDSNPLELTVHDLAGRLLWQHSFTSMVTLPTTSLTAGIYRYQLTDLSGRIQQGRFVKE